ncbi:MAG TPA: discoidin domain-containing protein [Polyangiaceae bacterium]|nr:discoidin domain-containing protein [Polyangiaceae bacterium]
MDENAANAAEVSVPKPNQVNRRGGLAGLWQWFWREDSMRELQRAIPAERARLLQSARATAEVGRRVEESPEPFEYRVDAILCDLYRQSIQCSLRALHGAPEPAQAPVVPAPVPAELLLKAVPDAETRRKIESAIQSGSFESFEELPERESAALVVALRKVATSLISELETDKRAVEALWTQRFLRLGLVLGLLGTIALVTMKFLDGAEQRRDLAAGANWRASSVYPGATGCRSPQQECNESPEFFFHTEEEQAPWIEFDLGSAQQISGARVDNRKDCCSERATPMVIEVSSDQHHWQRVARRDAAFTSWSAHFAPVQARWVRFRLEQRNALHLQHVRILR